MSAIEIYGRASADFDAKLAESQALLRQVGAELQPVVQASSLGAEDMVITHLLHHTATPARVFVLETGKLHAETLALITAIQTRYGITLDIYRPQPGSDEAFEAEHGADAMYKSIALRKACCGIRKMEPLTRALAGNKAWTISMGALRFSA